MRLSATTERELAAKLHHLDRIRAALRSGMMSVDEAARQLPSLLHGSHTLERVARGYLERPDVAPATKSGVRSFLHSSGAPLMVCELAELDAPRLSRWLERLRATHAPSSVTLAWRTLSMLVVFATARGWIGAAPWGLWRPKLKSQKTREREAARDPEELARLIRAAHDLDLETEAIRGLATLECKVVVAALLGLRQGELAGLLWTDVDEERSTVRVARQWVRGALRLPKGGRTSELVAAPEVLGVLRLHKTRLELAGLYDPAGPVFPNPSLSTRERPRPYTMSGPLSGEELRELVARAGLPHPERWSPHSLRDTFATLEQQGHAGDLRALSERTRHASMSSLVKYLRATKREPAAPGFSLPPNPARVLSLVPGPPAPAPAAPPLPPRSGRAPAGSR